MNIGIIGAGFTGLSAAFALQKLGHTVTVMKKTDSRWLGDRLPRKGMGWSLEKHYTTGSPMTSISSVLAREINHNVLIRRPKTSVYVHKKCINLILRTVNLSQTDPG